MSARRPDSAYRVRITNNLVASIVRTDTAGEDAVAESRLAAGAQLAANFQRNGVLDGDYCFRDAEFAKSFAVLALDFVGKLVERDIARLEDWDLHHQSDWLSGS